MDQLITWNQLDKAIRKNYAEPGNGRRPYPLSVMLRIHCLQLFYNLSDPAMEGALYEIESMRNFADLKITDLIPDETTILNFRHLLEKNKLEEKVFKVINKHIERRDVV